MQEQGWSSNLTVVRICNLDIDRNFSGVCVSPSVSFADSSLIRGSPACRKSLAEFRARRRERHADHFSRRRVRREKYTPACKCTGCPPLADSSCAQQAAACCRKTPKEFFDSLSSLIRGSLGYSNPDTWHENPTYDCIHRSDELFYEAPLKWGVLFC